MSISEEFKDQKVNALLEDYISLEKQINAIANKVIDTLETCDTRILDAITLGASKTKEESDVIIAAFATSIDNAVSKGKENAGDIGKSISELHEEAEEFKKTLDESIKDTCAFVSGKLNTQIDSEVARMEEAKTKLNEGIATAIGAMREEFKKHVIASRPISNNKFYGLCVAAVIFITGLSTVGMSFYAMAELNTVVRSSKQLMEFTKDTIKELPAKQRDHATKELDRIMNL
ncbi:MAG: hypothetical protein ACRC9N_11160 [Aeromonas sp.]